VGQERGREKDGDHAVKKIVHSYRLSPNGKKGKVENSHELAPANSIRVPSSSSKKKKKKTEGEGEANASSRDPRSCRIERKEKKGGRGVPL